MARPTGLHWKERARAARPLTPSRKDTPCSRTPTPSAASPSTTSPPPGRSTLTPHLAGEGGERPTLVYPKPNHEPASFTILNFPVDDIEAAVDELSAKGVVFETYAGTPMETDAKGVFRKGGPLIAWFTDPARNVLAVIEAPGPG